MPDGKREPATVEELQTYLRLHFACTDWDVLGDGAQPFFLCRCGGVSDVFDSRERGEAVMDNHIEAVSTAGKEYVRSWLERHPQAEKAIVVW